MVDEDLRSYHIAAVKNDLKDLRSYDLILDH
jgi:hypothetical protein